MRRVLITCTQPRANEIVHDLQSYSIDAHAMPTLLVEPCDISVPNGEFDVMLITSVHAINDKLPALPIIAIGEETASIAQKNGCDVVQVGTGGVDDVDLSLYSNVLYPCAEEPTLIPENTTPWHIYKTVKNNQFDISHDVDVICIFSIKTAKIIKKHDLTDKIILCLSRNIEQVFHGVNVADIASCTYPRYDAMKQLIDLYLRKHT
jgi:hypothetical protein